MFAEKIFLLTLCYIIAAEQDVLPVRLSPVSGRHSGENGETCPLSESLNQVKSNIDYYLNSTILPELASRSSGPSMAMCPCGGAGRWRKIAHLDMSDPNQQCPPNLSLYTTPVRSCGIGSSVTTPCSSALFPSQGEPYSCVCGRVIGYQRGFPTALVQSLVGGRGLEGDYLSGVSITQGAPGSRQHIWSFAAAPRENGSDDPSQVCPCTNTNSTWPYQIPPFIGNNYFCDTGNPGPLGSTDVVYADDPLWDGAGCGASNTCCQLNTPPWFCATLPQPTIDDIEMRICHIVNLGTVLLSLVDIYVM